MEVTFEVASGDFSNAGKVSSTIKSMLKQVAIDASLIKRIIVALYEAEVNVVAHSYGGTIRCWIESHEILIIVSDRGPGIPDLSLAMTEGYSTATPEVREMGFGAGMGLSNIRKNTDVLDIKTAEASPTIISMKFFIGENRTDV